MDTRSVYVILIVTVGLIFLAPLSHASAKTITVNVKAHFDKPCRDIFYLRMADNARDPVTGEHKGLIFKTPYFTATKTDYSYKIKVDTKKAPSGRIVTYIEVYDGLPNGKTYNKSVTRQRKNSMTSINIILLSKD
jgi:hypothetical protein